MSCEQTMASIAPDFGTCPFKPGQAYKVFFQKVYSTGSTKNGVATASATTLSSWSTLLAAVDETKIITTPAVGGGEVVPGEVKEFGGGDETPGGAPIPNGKAISKFTGKLYQSIQTAIAELKKLENVKGLGVYFVSQNDQITGKIQTISATEKITPIPLESLPYFKDLSMGKLETPVFNEFGFYIPENWSDALGSYTCIGIKDLEN